jgi:deoxyribose-phosphate aldolase
VTRLPSWLLPLAQVRLGRLIDHTLLKPEAGESDILALCDEAVELGFGAVCVNGQWVGLAAKRLLGTAVLTVGVVGFPLGASGRQSKVEEAKALHGDGAGELDVVQSLGWARTGQWSLVREELAAVVRAVPACPVKVIVETAALNPSEIEASCAAARAAGARFVKTSTGMHSAGGASEEAVGALRRAVGLELGVKASGGVRAPDAMLRMLRAGADRIGTSAAASWRGLVGSGGPTVAEALSGPE